MALRHLAQDPVSRVHTPVHLQNISLGFTPQGLIADLVSPRVKVPNQSDKYRIWGKNGMLVRDAKWHPGTIPNAISFRWSDDQFFADARKLRIPLLDSELRNADSDLDLRTSYTEVVTNALALARESRVATLFTDASKYSASHKIAKAGGSEWDTNLASDQPILDMQEMIAAVAKDAMCSTTALTVIIPEPVFLTALQNNTAILDRIKYSATGVVTTDLLRQVLNVKEVILASSMSAGAAPETADSDVLTGFSTTYLWGEAVWIGLVNRGMDKGVPYFARSYNWQAETGNQPRQVREYRMSDEGQEGNWIEVKEAVDDEKIAFADAGSVITNCLS